MILLINTSILAKHTMYQASLYSFWKNLSGHFDQFACNHSYGYALITGVLPVTLRARFAHVKLFLQFYQRIGQTVSLTDFIIYIPIVCLPMKYPG